MKSRMAVTICVAVGACVATACLPAQAQPNPQRAVVAAPDYDSGAAAGPMSDANFNTPESDGRPGVKFFTLAVMADKKGDYAHAVDMYKVASSWAYKPAEYNLGVMYFKGQGVPVDKPLGAAWMILAAERGTPPLYVKARDLMVTTLTDAQFAQTDKLWAKLRKTYGDKVALRRAKAQWAFVKSQQTGSRVGDSAVELHVGVFNMGESPHDKANLLRIAAGFEIQQAGSVDGAVAYRQFQQSSDPYSPIFLKNHTGTVTVSPLQELKEGEETSGKTANKPAPSSAGQDQQKPND